MRCLTLHQNNWSNFRNPYARIVEDVSATFPAAGIVLVAQNPSQVVGRETWQATKAQVLDAYAQQRGFGFLDVHQAFADLGTGLTSYPYSDYRYP